MTRYDLSRDYRHGVGIPEIIEQADGRFVRWEDAQRLREALRWNSAALLSYVAAADDEGSLITMLETGKKKRFGEILDMADAALSQEQEK